MVSLHSGRVEEDGSAISLGAANEMLPDLRNMASEERGKGCRSEQAVAWDGAWPVFADAEAFECGSSLARGGFCWLPSSAESLGGWLCSSNVLYPLSCRSRGSVVYDYGHFPLRRREAGRPFAFGSSFVRRTKQRGFNELLSNLVQIALPSIRISMGEQEVGSRRRRSQGSELYRRNRRKGSQRLDLRLSAQPSPHLWNTGQKALVPQL